MAETIIRALVFREGDVYVAQCLEYDIGAQAADLDTLSLYLDVAIDMEAIASMEAHGEPFAGIAPAPERFHDAWERRARSLHGERTLELKGGQKPVHVQMALAA